MKNKRAAWLVLALFAVRADADEPATDAVAEQAAAPEQPAKPPQKFNLWINGGLLSWHFNQSASYRGDNWGFGLQSDISPEVSLLAGNFINSDRARTHYAGIAWQPISWHGIKMGFAAGGFDGYPAMRDGGWFAAAIPWISVSNNRFGVNLTMVPNYGNRLHGALSAQFVMRVW